jgi:hypothetical protein
LSERELAVLTGELVDLPCLDLSLRVKLPKLLSPALGRLCEGIAEDDEPAGEAVLDEVLDALDTPRLRAARLAATVIALRDAGGCSRLLAAVALIDLASGSRQLLCASVIQAVAVRAGVERTPGGVLLAALVQAARRCCGSRAARRARGRKGATARRPGRPWRGAARRADALRTRRPHSAETAPASERGQHRCAVRLGPARCRTAIASGPDA